MLQLTVQLSPLPQNFHAMIWLQDFLKGLFHSQHTLRLSAIRTLQLSTRMRNANFNCQKNLTVSLKKKKTTTTKTNKPTLLGFRMIISSGTICIHSTRLMEVLGETSTNFTFLYVFMLTWLTFSCVGRANNQRGILKDIQIFVTQ